MAQNSFKTKSIDVGSMFLMDLSVQEASDLNIAGDATIGRNQAAAFESIRNYTTNTKQVSTHSNPHLTSIASTDHHHNSNNHHHSHHHHHSNHRSRQQVREPRASDYLASSLDRIASVINCDMQHNHQQHQLGDDEHNSLTIVEAQPIEYSSHEPHCSSSRSLSDESFVASSGTSLSSASYGIGSVGDNEDKVSTTTREDSGVLDMRDLDGHLIDSYENSNDSEFNQGYHRNQPRLDQEKPISVLTMESNLINSNKLMSGLDGSGSNSNSNHQSQKNYINRHTHRPGRPTEGSGISNNNYHNHNHHHSSHSRRSMSASVPIQVPVRQMRKDLNKMKLKLMTNELVSEHPQQQQESSPNRTNGHLVTELKSRATFVFGGDDDDAFLEQEFNENHHNHYPINDRDDERLRADEDPMRLFANIQALAKSLHEDAELFGSLPPKRLFESPVRSIALF